MARGERVTTWTPAEGERVLPVVGAHGTAGASTLALAIATVAAPARVVECARTTRSGSGRSRHRGARGRRDGWLLGTRDSVVLERWNDEDHGEDADSRPSANSTRRWSTSARTSLIRSGRALADGSTLERIEPGCHRRGPLLCTGIRRIQQTLSVIVHPRRCVVATPRSRSRTGPRVIVRQALR